MGGIGGDPSFPGLCPIVAPQPLPWGAFPAPLRSSRLAVIHLPLPNPALAQTLCVTLENPFLPSVPHFSCKGRAERVSEGEGGVMGSSPRVGSASEPQKYRPRWVMPRSTVCACEETAQDPCSTEYY